MAGRAVAESPQMPDIRPDMPDPTRRILLIGITAALLTTAAMPAWAQNADYQAKLAQYTQAFAAYQEEASVYWDEVAAKRRVRNAKRRTSETILDTDYVLTQPPVYSGPPRPVDPNAPGPPPDDRPPIPLLADFLKNAAEHFAFVPDRPQSELEFKRAYAQAASAAGLTRDQIVGVYAFETGGNGTYDMQSGVTPTRPRAISPAMGYNQLLSTNTISLLAEHGNRFLVVLRQKSKPLTSPEKIAMERKLEALKRMIAFARTGPQKWSEWDRVAKTTPAGMGTHAAVLDRDIGPLLQVQKLINSVHFARAKHYEKPLTAAELELMNLTGDGNGIDMVLMPQELRARVPTSNFFQQNGYERNPVARRTGVVAKLIADMEAQMARGAQSPGARELAAAF
jgi:hypothetical protein